MMDFMQEIGLAGSGLPVHRSAPTAQRRWTFLTNHSHVLLTIAGEPDLRLREIAGQVGITERATQLIIGDLVDEGYLTRTKVGRRNHYTVAYEAPLRHPMMQGQPVSHLIKIFKEAFPTGS